MGMLLRRHWADDEPVPEPEPDAPDAPQGTKPAGRSRTKKAADGGR